MQTHKQFDRLSVHQRWRLLNQGEYVPLDGSVANSRSLIRWEEDYPFHTAISALAALSRLVTGSRAPARDLAGFVWSEPCREPSNLASVPAPEYPDLDRQYDICIIGSGAGGAVVAARAVSAGKRVLIIEQGDWVSPDALIEREIDATGQVRLQPPRDDRVLMHLYADAGGRVAGGLNSILENPIDVLIPWRRRQLTPQQSINLIQAKVVGGGPYVNNAIHLPIEEDAWNKWGPRQPAGVSYADFAQRMQQVNATLGVNTIATQECAGLRSVRFIDGAAMIGDLADPLPVSITPECLGCGADNSVDPFGEHTGGIHPYRLRGPNSYLMQAIAAPRQPAVVAYSTAALALHVEPDERGVHRAVHLVVDDRRGQPPGCPGIKRTVHARQFVLAAGTLASTKLLHDSLCPVGIYPPGLGERLAANVVTPVYAVFDNPIIDLDDPRPEPGIAQCYFVNARLGPDGRPIEPALENWFHYPGTLAVALTGWFQHYASVIRRYNHIAIAGAVVPTAVRPSNRIEPDGTVNLQIDGGEFELLLAGLEKIGRIFLAAATPEGGVTIYLPTRALLLDACDRPITIRSVPQLRAALDMIRRRGPAFLNLATAHPQGGNALGDVVDPVTFRVRDGQGGEIDNLYVADASIFPAGCEVNPQLTVKALASIAAARLLEMAG
jgi:choline dehydrogenase-like flavoprotein